MNFYAQLIGGIGDILLAMMKPGSPLGYFRALKDRGDETMVVVHANTDEAYRLFQGLPYVDYLRFRGKSLKIDTAPAKQQFSILNRYDGLRWEQPRIVLDDDEATTLLEITREPYVAVHLTASLMEKVPPKFWLLLDKLQAANIRTVLLGNESFDDAPAVKGNRVQGFYSSLLSGHHILLPPKLRLHVAAAQCARKFIGTLSCFNCAAQLSAVPSFVLVNRSLQEPGVYRMMQKNGAIIRPWNEWNLNPGLLDAIYDEVVRWASQ